MSSYVCSICGLSEYEYEGKRAEYSPFLAEVVDYEYSYMCGGCKEVFMGKLIKSAGKIVEDIIEPWIIL